MSCPFCGANQECRCSTREFQPRHVRRPRFQPDQPARRFANAASDSPPGFLAEGESSDFSERQFAASLEASSASMPKPRFVLNAPGEKPVAASQQEDERGLGAPSGDRQIADGDIATSLGILEAAYGSEESLQSDQNAPGDVLNTQRPPSWISQEDDQGWREEIAERVHKYRVRRRRAPRYPSLSLKFDAPEARYASVSAADAASPISLDGTAPEMAELAVRRYSNPAPAVRPVNLEPKIIEFPKPVPAPLPILDVPVLDELAEPIVEGPRILDAPETLPQIAPLAGITLDPPEPAAALELPLQVATVASRFAAVALDGCFILMAAALFSTIVFKTTSGMSARTIVEIAVGVSAVLWSVYEYVLITYSGSTPGMEMAQMRLSCFDGESPGKRRRRGRALAMILSAVSFGLGFLWCLFDEDTLCWHDRITRTYPIRGARGGIFAATGALISGLLSGNSRT